MSTNLVTPRDVEDAVRWMVTRWPSAHRDWAEWKSLIGEFDRYTVGTLKESLHVWNRRGERSAPNSSQLSRLCSEIQAARIDRGVDALEFECTNHRWADPQPYDEDRHRTCVNCGEAGPESSCVEHHFNDHGRCTYCPACKHLELTDGRCVACREILEDTLV